MRFTLTILLVAIGFLAAAQQPLGRKWDARYGGTDDEGFCKIYRMPDGGYAMGGWSYSGQDGDKSTPQQGYGDYYVVRTDSLGNKLWDRSYGTSGYEIMWSMCVTSDGGCLLAGHTGAGVDGDKTEASRGSTDYWVVRLDPQGNKLWDRRYGGPGYEGLLDAKTCRDGGFILSGYSRSNAGGDKSEDNGGGENSWVVRIDSMGNKLWDKTFRSAGQLWLWAGLELDDGGFVFAGDAWPDSTYDISEYGDANHESWAVRTDASGTIIWDKRYVGTGLEYLAPDGNGGFAMLGDDRIFRIDSSGNTLWETYYFAGGYPTGFVHTSDGGFLASQYTGYYYPYRDKSETSLGHSQTWVLKVNRNGNKIWDKTIFTWETNAGHAIESTPGCIVIGADCRGGIGGYKTQPNWDVSLYNKDFWLVELCEGWVDTTLCPQQPCTGITETPTLQAKLYPNPTNGALTIELPTGQEGNITLYNLLGQNVFNAYVNGTATIQTDLPKGVYIYRIGQGGKYLNGKLLVE